MRRIDFSKQAEKDKHDRIVHLVQRMIEFASRLQTAHSDAEREAIQNNLASTDRNINALVYELYAISATNQRMIEEGTIPKQLSGRKKKSRVAAVKLTKVAPKTRAHKADLQPALFSG